MWSHLFQFLTWKHPTVMLCWIQASLSSINKFFPFLFFFTHLFYSGWLYVAICVFLFPTPPNMWQKLSIQLSPKHVYLNVSPVCFSKISFQVNMCIGVQPCSIILNVFTQKKAQVYSVQLTCYMVSVFMIVVFVLYTKCNSYRGFFVVAENIVWDILLKTLWPARLSIYDHASFWHISKKAMTCFFSLTLSSICVGVQLLPFPSGHDVKKAEILHTYMCENINPEVEKSAYLLASLLF